MKVMRSRERYGNVACIYGVPSPILETGCPVNKSYDFSMFRPHQSQFLNDVQYKHLHHC